MRQLFIVATAALALFVALPTLARAQAVPVQRPFRVRFGAHFPGDGALRNDVGKEWFSVGASYDVRKTLAVAPRIVEVYVDHTAKRFGGGYGASGVAAAAVDEVRVTGIGVAGRFYGDPVTAATQKYVGGGLGVYRVRVVYAFGGESETQTQLGGKVLAGLQARSGLFAEANYVLLGEAKGINPSGLGLQVGYRF